VSAATRRPSASTYRAQPLAAAHSSDEHVKLSAQATRLIEGDFARLLRNPAVRGANRKRSAAPSRNNDAVLGTQDAADLVGMSRPYIVARIEAGDIPLHQQVGNQRRVLKSAVECSIDARPPARPRCSVPLWLQQNRHFGELGLTPGRTDHAVHLGRGRAIPAWSSGNAQLRFSLLFPYHQEKSTGHFCQVLDFPTEFGRRDWTRTNDPHHVKVGKRDFLERPGIAFS